MAITTYAELQTAVGNWLNRSDLTSRIPEFIALAEADMRRQLRDGRETGSLNMTSGSSTSTVPSDVKFIDSIRYDEDDKQYPLRKLTSSGLARARRLGSGTPQAYAVIGTHIHWDIEPSDAFATETTYVTKVTPLSVSNTTNATLTSSPDIYLYGTLLQAAPYLEHDERIATWSALYADAVLKENAYRDGVDFGAGAEMDLPVVFGEDC